MKERDMREQKLVNYSIIFMGLALLALVLQLFQAVLRPLAIAFLLVLITTPLVRYSKQKHIPVWLTFLGLIIVAIGLLILVSSLVSLDNSSLAEEIPRFREKISQGSGPVLKLASKLGFGLDKISAEDIGKIAAKGALIGLGAIRTLLSELLLAMILLMFVVQSRPAFFGMVERRYGADELHRIQDKLKKIQGDVVTYFGTKTLMSLGTAALSLIVLLLFGARFISVSVLLIFLLNYIPIIGSMVALVVVVMIYLITMGLSASVGWLFLALLAVQVLFGNILEPRLAGKRLNISPILILISLYVWAWIWGVVGMFLAMPLTIMVLVMIRHTGKNGKPAHDDSNQAG